MSSRRIAKLLSTAKNLNAPNHPADFECGRITSDSPSLAGSTLPNDLYNWGGPMCGATSRHLSGHITEPGNNIQGTAMKPVCLLSRDHLGSATNRSPSAQGKCYLAQFLPAAKHRDRTWYTGSRNRRKAFSSEPSQESINGGIPAKRGECVL
jgi:hypothetical protein